jgi:hypothetical protein
VIPGLLLAVPISVAAADRATPSGNTDPQGVTRQDEATFGWPQSKTPSALDYVDLESGFPVQAFHTGGTYHSGSAIHTLVVNIDGDSELEIVVTALATGPLYAWNADGTAVPGWPPGGTSGAGYAAAGNLEGSPAAGEVFSGFWDATLVAFRKDGSAVPGWPRTAANYVSTPPAVTDVDGDGLDEIFLGEEDWKLHAYRADGTPLPGWPVHESLGGQERHTPAVGDLDGDGDLEIVSASGSSTPGVYLFAYHHDGTTVDGFPVLFSKGYVDTFPTIGDVDGDHAPEIVVVLKQSSFPWLPVVSVLSADGTVERTWTGSSTAPYGTAPALADLDGDTVPEVIVQTDEHLHAWDGFGKPLPGWPVTWSSRWLGNSAPVVGDVDGDRLPDIVVTTQVAGSSGGGEARAFDRLGSPLAGFPKSIPLGAGAVPAIADLDADGRNEIVITGSFWNLFPGFYDKVWVYDLGGADHGPVQWGQFGKSASHAGRFATRIATSLAGDVLSWTASDAATAYDVVRGDLSMLRDTGGDFMTATTDCIGEDRPQTSLEVFGDPGADQGFWYLVRPVTDLGTGTYDSGGAGQAGPRDAGINTASGRCL